jgi:hypothetical protein
MEEGLVLDKGHGGELNVPEWLEGPPERSFWFGIKTKGKERFAIRTLRCQRCGYLESYANESRQ